MTSEDDLRQKLIELIAKWRKEEYPDSIYYRDPDVNYDAGVASGYHDAADELEDVLNSINTKDEAIRRLAEGMGDAIADGFNQTDS
jgi:hypothetical protein